jgi:hypothetical protein
LTQVFVQGHDGANSELLSSVTHAAAGKWVILGIPDHLLLRLVTSQTDLGEKARTATRF